MKKKLSMMLTIIVTLSSISSPIYNVQAKENSIGVISETVRNEERVGVSSMEGILKEITTIQDTIYIIVEDEKGAEELYYASADRIDKGAISKLGVGDKVYIHYALGTPAKYKSLSGFPFNEIKKVEENKEATISRIDFLSKLIKETGLNIDGIRFIKAPLPSEYASDITVEDPHASDIIIAGFHGIFDKEAENTFKPNEPITREEAAAWTCRALEKTVGPIALIRIFYPLNDEKDIKEGYGGYIQESCILGLIKIDEKGYIYPKKALQAEELDSRFWINLRTVIVSKKSSLWGKIDNSQKDVVQTKEWNVKFSSKIKAESLNKQNIYVLDQNKNLVPVTVVLQKEDESCVKIFPPEGGYMGNGSYTIYITSDVESMNGKLKSGFYMPFTVVSSK